MLALLSLTLSLSLQTGLLPSTPSIAPRCPVPVALFGWGGGGKKAEAPSTAGLSARDADFARRQDKLAARKVSSRRVHALSWPP
jgi:hypothetical protein